MCGAPRRLTQDLPGLGVERSEQRKRAVSVVLEPMALCPPRRQRQHGILSVERLDGGLLVDTEHRRMGRGIQVQPNNVRCLGLEIRILGRQVLVEPVGLQSMTRPYPSHHHVGHAQLLGQAPRASERRTIGRLLPGGFKDPSFKPRGQLRRRLTSVARVQTRAPLLFETTRPARNKPVVAVQRFSNLRPGRALRQHQDAASTARFVRSATVRSHSALQLNTLLLRQFHRLKHRLLRGLDYTTFSIVTVH